VAEPEQGIQDELALAERRYERALERARTLPDQRIVQRIGTDLGDVIVDGYGGLREVRIDPDGLRYATGRSLAAAVLTAITTAEQKAKALRAN
jgi:DNA-binding protein YbaB